MAKRSTKKRIRTQKRSVGRPEHRPDAKSRRIVERLASCGMSQREIAAAIGITWPTLTKHYEDELISGPARKKAEVINMLFTSAKAGNVSAQRKLVAMTGGEVPTNVGDRLPDAPTTSKKVKLGKKDQQALEAESVGGIYETPAPPRLVINNK